MQRRFLMNKISSKTRKQLREFLMTHHEELAAKKEITLDCLFQLDGISPELFDFFSKQNTEWERIDVTMEIIRILTEERIKRGIL